MNTRQIALITGANRGLGLAVARLLGRRGATVIVGARDSSRGEEAAQQLRTDGIDAHTVALDVTSAASVAAAAGSIGQRFERLDVLVNNAGILPEATAADAETPLDLELFRSTFETNLFGTVRITQALLPLLSRSSAGRIVNVSSAMGSLAEQLDPDSPYHGLVLPAYQTSKAALNGVTVALSKALAASSITVVSVCPGWVQTDLGGPANREAAPLTSDEAAVVVAEAALDPARRTGEFVSATGPVAW